MPIAYTESHSLNMLALLLVSFWERDLKLILNTNLLLCFVCTSGEGSGETVRLGDKPVPFFTYKCLSLKSTLLCSSHNEVFYSLFKL